MAFVRSGSRKMWLLSNSVFQIYRTFADFGDVWLKFENSKLRIVGNGVIWLVVIGKISQSANTLVFSWYCLHAYRVLLPPPPPPLLLLCVFAICTAVAVAVAAFAAFAARHRVPNGQICRCFKVTFGNSCG